MKLEGRLLAIANLIDKGSKVADIGTDHGYIPAYLAESNISNYIVAADVNKLPLEKARKEIKRRKIKMDISLRLGSGLEVLQINEVDEVIIAGMGGVLIAQLLETSFEIAKNLKKIILQPMQASQELRRYLYENGFEIQKEQLVKEEFRVYEIIVVKYTGKIKEVKDDIEFEISKTLIEQNDPLILEFLNNKLKKYETILSKVNNIDNIEVIKKRELTIKRIAKIQELIEDEIKRDN